MSIEPIAFRNALGRFATGVCVITTNSASQPALGMTVNSFASLSLDPPLVLWSIQKNSDCLAAFDAADGFCVNVLRASQQQLSGRFARKAEHQLNDSDDYFLGETMVPVLRDSLVSFECSKADRINGGDHFILVGRVESMHVGDEGEPLLFYSGGYRQLL